MHSLAGSLRSAQQAAGSDSQRRSAFARGTAAALGSTKSPQPICTTL
jgi:hypothetical protein